MRVDLVVRNGVVVDGTGGPRRAADVAVKDGVVVEVGTLDGVQGDRTIDADGLIVAPGFIDPHTHLDPQLNWDPFGSPSILHGVTTVMTGNCSVTIAPCRTEHRDALSRLFYLVEEIPLEAFQTGIDWQWESFGEYLDALDRRLGINVAALVGHSAVRYFVMGADSYEREATAPEIAAMRELVRQSLLGGAVGFSTSRTVFHVGEGGRPIPSRLASHEELFALCDVLGEVGSGIFQTDGGELTHAVPDYVRQVAGPVALRTGRTVLLSGTLHEWNTPHVWSEVHRAVADFQAQGASIFTQASPCRIDVSFRVGTALIFQDLPGWAEVLGLDHAAQLAALRDPAVRDTLQFQTVDDTSACYFSRRWDTVVVAAVAHERNQSLVGTSIAELAAQRGVRVIDALLDLALDEDLATDFLLAGSANGDDDAVAAMLRSPQAIVGFSDAGAHVRTLCGAGDTSLLLARWVREEGVLTLEEAVAAMTSRPAEVLGLVDRGVLAPGQAADIVVFDPDTVAYTPTRLVRDLPGGGERLWRDAAGIEHVVVNGALAVTGSTPTGELAGRTLRGAAGR